MRKAAAGAAPEITAGDLAERLRQERPPVLLDVRREDEVRVARIAGARHIPLDELPQRWTELDPAAALVVYCHHGVRSAQAAAFLRQAGFTDVASLRGGIDAWAREIDPRMPRY